MRAGAVLAAVGAAAAAPSFPRFSWDTVPVFYHSCNFTGPYTDDALKVVAKFPMVTIEKGQGVTLPGYAEDKILDTLKRVKEIDSNISTIFYYNSVLDWPFYRLHEQLLQHPELQMHDADGKVCRTNGDGSFPNHTDMLSFDFTQAAGRKLWLDACVKLAKTGYVDGCFSDRAGGRPHCTLPNQTAFDEGHVLVHQELQKELGPGGVVIANNDYDMPGVSATQIEGFAAKEESIKALISTAALGKIVEAHAGYGEDGGDNHCSNNITNSLAAFLIGAGRYSFYACSRGWKVSEDPVEKAWHPEYDKPLGEPLGLAVKTGSVYTRSFRSGTKVTFDVATNTGTIDWSS